MKFINKSMSRSDLSTPDAFPVVQGLNDLIRDVASKNLAMSSWVGTLPDATGLDVRFFLQNAWKALRGKPKLARPSADVALARGMQQRLDYQPLEDMADDLRYPWFLYWEAFWALHNTKAFHKADMRILDGGGTSSLFTCYLASLGYEVHSVHLNKKLKRNGDLLARSMNWNMKSYTMNLMNLDFPDQYFDHAYSICVFEHLDYDIKQSALAEIARCLKPNGILSITFDYRNPAPGVVGYGKDLRSRNALKSLADIKRNFLSTGHFQLLENPEFQDNGESYLSHPLYKDQPYTFGAIFLQKVGN
jgi:SAM-dependent methyltransferase